MRLKKIIRPSSIIDDDLCDLISNLLRFEPNERFSAT